MTAWGRVSLRSLVVLVIVLGMAASSMAATEITYWHGFTGPDRPLMEQLIAEFNETHPGIEVNAQAIPWGTLFQQLAPAVAAGRAPDVVVLNEDVITAFIARGALMELTPDLLKSAGIDRSRFYASLWNTGSYQGKDYGVPIHSVALVMYYNTDLFRKAGLDPSQPPRNRAEFLEAMQRLTIDKNGRHAAQSGFDPDNVVQWGTMLPLPWMGGTVYYSMLLQNGGTLVSQDASSATFNSPEAVEALEFFTDLIYEYHVSPPNVTEDGSIAAFRQGKVATNFNGVWRLEDFRRQEGLNFAVAPFPRLGTKQEAAWGGSSHLAIPKQRRIDPKRLEASLTFLNWITLPPQNLFWTGAGGLPTQPLVAADPSFEGNPMKPVFATLANVQPTSGYPWVAQVRGSLDAAVGDAMLGKKTPKKALDDGVAEANQLIKEAMQSLSAAP